MQNVLKQKNMYFGKEFVFLLLKFYSKSYFLGHSESNDMHIEGNIKCIFFSVSAKNRFFLYVGRGGFSTLRICPHNYYYSVNMFNWIDNGKYLQL